MCDCCCRPAMQYCSYNLIGPIVGTDWCCVLRNGQHGFQRLSRCRDPRISEFQSRIPGLKTLVRDCNLYLHVCVLPIPTLHVATLPCPSTKLRLPWPHYRVAIATIATYRPTTCPHQYHVGSTIDRPDTILQIPARHRIIRYKCHAPPVLHLVYHVASVNHVTLTISMLQMLDVRALSCSQDFLVAPFFICCCRQLQNSSQHVTHVYD